MEFTAKLVQVRDAQTGEGKNGPWKRQEYIFETDGQYPKKICVTVWGDRAIQDQSIITIGNLLDVHFDLESREHNDRWYSDIKAWKIVKHGEHSSGDYNNGGGNGGYSNGNGYGSAPITATSATHLDTPAPATTESADDLPF